MLCLHRFLRRWVHLQSGSKQIQLLYQNCLIFITLMNTGVCMSGSTEAVPASTWRRISSCVTPPVLAQRPSLTCERWAPGSASRRASTWSSRPPSNPPRRQTSSWGCSPRNSRRLSESVRSRTRQIFTLLIYSGSIYNIYCKVGSGVSDNVWISAGRWTTRWWQTLMKR